MKDDDETVYDAPKHPLPGTPHVLNAFDAWDHIHRLFGVGDWTREKGPWWEHRRDMGTRLKSRMTRLSQTPADVIREADYCKAMGIDIQNATWVTKYYYEAKRWAEKAENERSRATIEDRISAAIAVEYEHDPKSAWIDKLVLSQGPAREEVLTEWQTWNESRRAQSSSSSPRRSSKSDDRTA